MSKAYTVMELILIIVLIGLLAGVAVTRLSVTRDDAHTGICVYEVTYLTREVANSYTVLGHTIFIKKLISNMTNIRIIGQNTGFDSGIKQDNTMIEGIQYFCESEKLITLTYVKNRLYLQVFEPLNPVGYAAFIRLKKNLDLNETYAKYYDF